MNNEYYGLYAALCASIPLSSKFFKRLSSVELAGFFSSQCRLISFIIVNIVKYR